APLAVEQGAGLAQADLRGGELGGPAADAQGQDGGGAADGDVDADGPRLFDRPALELAGVILDGVALPRGDVIPGATLPGRSALDAVFLLFKAPAGQRGDRAAGDVEPAAPVGGL